MYSLIGDSVLFESSMASCKCLSEPHASGRMLCGRLQYDESFVDHYRPTWDVSDSTGDRVRADWDVTESVGDRGRADWDVVTDSVGDRGRADRDVTDSVGDRGRADWDVTDDRPMFSFKVIKALSPRDYRNIEYDNWRDAQNRRGDTINATDVIRLVPPTNYSYTHTCT